MGFFGKKKKEENQTSAIFQQYNYQQNSGKAPEQMSRREQNRAQEAKQETNVREKNIAKALQNLSNIMMEGDRGFERFIDDIEKMQELLRSGKETANKAALSSVDSLLLKAIDDASSYCRRGNFVATRACMGILKGYVNDRQDGGSYYTDPKYIKAKLESDALHVEIEKQKMERKKLTMESQQLREDLQNGYVTEREVVARLSELKADAQKIDDQIAHYAGRRQVLEDMMSELKKKSVTHATGYDLNDEMDDALTAKRENEHDSASYDKFHEQFSTSHKKVLASTLAVDDNAMNASNDNAVKLTDQMFDF